MNLHRWLTGKRNNWITGQLVNWIINRVRKLPSYQINQLTNFIVLSIGLTFLTIQSTWAAGAGVTLTTADVTTTVQQGGSGQPVWRLMFTVPSGTIVGVNLTLVHVRHIGSLPHAQVTKVALYRSSSPAFGVNSTSLASGTLDANGDVTLKGFTMNVWGFEDFGMFYFDRYAFLVIDVSGAASTSDTIRLSLLDKTWVKFGGSDNVQAAGTFPQTSGNIFVFDNTSDAVTVTPSAPAAGLSRGLQEVVLALTLTTTGSTVLNQVKFSLTNNPADVASVKLYRESGGAGWQTTDTPVGSPVTTFGVNRLGTFSGLTEMFAGAGAVLYLAVSLKPDAALGQTFSLRLPDNGYVSVGSPDLVGAFTAGSGDLLVEDPIPAVTVRAAAVAPAVLTQGLGTGDNPYERAAFLRLTLVTNVGEAVWGGIQVSLLGTLDPYDVEANYNEYLGMYLYKDDNPADGTWQTTDTSLAWSNNSDYYPTMALIGFSETLTSSPARYFLVGGVDEARVGQTVGLAVANAQAISLVGGPATVATNTFPLSSGVGTTIVDRPDQLVLFDGLSPVGTADPWYPGIERQFLRWNMNASNTNGQDEKVHWTSLRLSMTGNLSLSDLAYVVLYRVEAGGLITSTPLVSLATFGLNRWITLSGFDESVYSIPNDHEIKGCILRVKVLATASPTTAVSLGFAPVALTDLVVSPPESNGVFWTTLIPAVPLTPLTRVTMTTVPVAPASLFQGTLASLFRAGFTSPSLVSVSLKTVRLEVQTSGPLKLALTFWRSQMESQLYMESGENMGGTSFQCLGATLATLNVSSFNATKRIIHAEPNSSFNALDIVGHVAPDSPPGVTMALSLLGVVVDPVNITLIDGGGPKNTGTITVEDRPDTLTLSAMDATVTSPNAELRGGYLRMNSPRTLVNLTIKNPSGDNIYGLAPLKVSLLGNVPERDVLVFLNDVNDLQAVGPDRTVTFTGPWSVPSFQTTTVFSMGVIVSPEAMVGETVGLSLFTGGDFAPTLDPPDSVVMLGAGSSRIVSLIPYDSDVAELHGLDDGLPSDVDSNGLSPVVKLTAWTTMVGGEGRVFWKGLTVSLWSDGLIENVNFGKARVVLYKDSNTNGVWDSVDSAVASGTGVGNVPMTFLTLTGFRETLTSTNPPRIYFLALSLTEMDVGKEFGTSPIGWSLEAPDVASPVTAPDISSIRVTPLEMVTMSVHYLTPAVLTQGTGATFLRITLTTTGQTGLQQFQLSLIKPSVGVTGTVFLYEDDGSEEGVYDATDDLRAFTPFNFLSGSRLTLTYFRQLGPTPPTQRYLVRLSLNLNLSAAPSEEGGVGVVVEADALKVALPDQVAMMTPIYGPPGAELFAMFGDMSDTLSPQSFVPAVPVGFGFKEPLAPQSLFRFEMWTNRDQVTLTSLKFTLAGGLGPNPVDPAWIKSVSLYQEKANPSASWSTADLLLGRKEGFTSREATLTDLSVTIPGFAFIPPQYFYLVLEPSSLAPVNATLGIGGFHQTWFTVSGVDQVSWPGLTLMASAIRLSDLATYSIDGVAAPENGVRTQQPAAFLRFAPIAQIQSTLTALRISLTGSAIPVHLASAQIFRDTTPPGNAWNPEDRVVGTLTFSGNRWATLEGLSEVFSNSPDSFVRGLFFAVITPAEGGAGFTVGLTMTGPDNFSLSGVHGVTPSGGGGSSLSEIVPAGTDFLRVSWGSVAGSQTYREIPTPRLRMNLSVDHYDAKLTALKVTFTGTISNPIHLTALFYKDGSILASAPFGSNREALFTGLEVTLLTMGREFVIGIIAGPGANSGALLNVAVASPAAFTLETPDRVSPLFVPSAIPSVELVGSPSVTLEASADASATQITLGSTWTVMRLTLRTAAGIAKITRVELSLFGTAVDVGGAFVERFTWTGVSPIFGGGGRLTLTVSASVGNTPSVLEITVTPKAAFAADLLGKTIGAALVSVQAVGAASPYQVYQGGAALPAVGGLPAIVKARGYIHNLLMSWAPGYSGTVNSGRQTIVKVPLKIGNLGLPDRPPAQPPVVLRTMVLSLESPTPTQFAAVLFKDDNGEEGWQLEDTSLTAGTFGVNGRLTLAGTGWPMNLSSGVDTFLVALRPFGEFPSGDEAVLQKPVGFDWLTFAEPDLVADTALGKLTLTMNSSNCDGVVGGTAPASPTLTWSVNSEAAWLVLTLVTDGTGVDTTAQLTALGVNLSGGVGREFVTLKLYEDRGAPGWQAGIDLSLAVLTQFDDQLRGTFGGFTSTVSPTGLTYFITGRVGNNAPSGASTGVVVGFNSMGFTSPDLMSIFTPGERYPIPQQGTFQVMLSGTSQQPPSIPPGTRATIFSFALSTNGGAAYVNRVSLSLAGNLPAAQGVWSLNGLIGTASDSPFRVVTFTGMDWNLSAATPFLFSLALSLIPSATPSATIGVRVVPVGGAPPVGVTPADLAPLPTFLPQWSIVYVNPVLAGEVSVVGHPAATTLTQGVQGVLLTLAAASTNASLAIREVTISLVGSDDPSLGTWELGPVRGTMEGYRTVTFRGVFSTTTNYLLYFTPALSCPIGTLIGATLLPDSANLLVDFPGTLLPFGGIGTSLFAVRDGPDSVIGGGRDLAPARIPAGTLLPFYELTLAAATEVATWTGMMLNIIGTLNPTWVGEVRLYRDDPPDGVWNGNETLLGSGTYAASIVGVSLGGWTEVLDTYSSRRYFLSLSLKPGAVAEAGNSVGLNARTLTVEGGSIPLLASGLSKVIGSVLMEGENIAPAGLPPGGSAAFLRLSLRTAPGVTATLTALTLQIRGELDPNRFSLYLVRDEVPANGQWEGGETRLGTLTGRGTYDVLHRGVFTGLQITLGETPVTYFIALTLDASASENTTVGLSLVNPLAVLAPATVEAFTGGSRLITVDGPDELRVGVVALVVTNVLQNNFFSFVQVTLTANQDQGQLQSLRLSLTGDLPPAFAQVHLLNSNANFGADRWASLKAIARPVTTIPLVDQVQLRVSFNAPIGRTVGLVIPGAEAWGVDAPDTVVMSPASLMTPMMTVQDSSDNLIVVAQTLVFPSAVVGAEQAFLRLSLTLSGDELVLRTLRLTLLGTVLPSWVTARLYRDDNVSNLWEKDEDPWVSTATFASDLMGSFASLDVTIAISPVTLTATPPKYFVTLSLSSPEAVGLTLGVGLLNQDAGSHVDPPDTISASGFSALREVKRPELLALSSDVLAPPVLLSGTRITLMRLGLEPTQGSFATWTSLRLSVTGTLPPDDLLFELSRADGTLLKPLRIGTSHTGVFTGLQEVVNTSQSYFLTATHLGTLLHRTFGVTLKSNDFVFGDGGFPVAGFKTGVSSVFVKQPAEVRLTVQSFSPLTITQGASPQALWTLTLQTDQDLAVARAVVLSLGPVPTAPGLAVRLYRETLSPDTWTESDESLTGAEASTGPWLTLSGFTHTLTSTPARYHVVVAPAVSSAVGLLQFTLHSAWGQWEWAQSVRGSGEAGALTVSDAPDRVTLFAADTGPATHRQNAERAYLALTLAVDQDSLQLTTLRVALHPEGTLDPTLVGALQWYVDNGDGGWDPGQDTLLASASWANGLAALAPSLTVLGGRVITFLTVPLSPGVPAGRTLGLSLLSDPLTVLAPDTVVSFTGFASALKTVVVGVPLTLTVSSSDPGTSVLQGTTRFTLLSLTLSNGSAIGDFTAVEGLTFHVSPSSELLALWVEAEGVTLGASSDTGATRQLSLAAQIAGTPHWQVCGALAPLALPGTLRITMTGVGVGLPDVVSLESLGAVGTALITDAPDTVTVTGVPRTATRLVRGASFTSLLTVTAQVTSLPQDSARLQALVVSLTGHPPVGGNLAAFQDAFTVGLLTETGDTLVTSATFTQRVATLTLSTSLVGETSAAWILALSLAANAPLLDVYGGLAGLTLVAVGLDGVDVSQLTASLAHPPVVLFDQKIHVRRGLGAEVGLGLTLGQSLPLIQVTLATDRDAVRLRALKLSLIPSWDTVGPEDFYGLRLYRETGGTGFALEQEVSLGSAVWHGSEVSLWAGVGITLTSEGVTLWVVGRVNPFYPPHNFLTIQIAESYDAPVAVTPATLSVSGYYGIDAAATLRVGATALLPSVVLTGETVSAFKLSLQAVGGGVGVTLVGLEINALEAVSLAPYLTYHLMEGNRLLATGGVKATLATALQVTFGLREPIYETPVYWELLLTIAPETPSQRFNVTFHPLQTQLAGGEDVVLGSAVTTVTTEVIASWGASRLQVLGATSPLPSGGSLAARGAVIPVARLVVKTAEAGMRAKLALLRARRLGQGRDDDVKLAVYRSPATLLTFDPGAAVRLGRGAVMHRLATVSLTVRPFFTFEEPMALWLVAEIQPEALIGATWGLEVEAPGFVGQGLVDVQSADLPLRTPWLTLWDTTPSSLAITWAGSSGSLVTQGTRITLGGFTTQLEAGPGSVITGVRLTTTGPLPGLQVLNAAGESVLRGARVEGALLRLTLTLPVTATAQHYPLVVSLPPTALVGTTLQITVGPEDVLGPTLDTRTGNGGVAWSSGAFVVTDAPDTLTLSARPRPVPWEVSDWTPAFLITLSVNQDEASLIRITLLRFGDLMIDDLVIATFRWRISNMVVPVVAQSLGSGLIGLSFNHQITRSPDPQMGTLELSLAPSINLTGTLGLSLLGVGLAPDPVTGLVADTVVFTPVGTSLLGIRNPAQPFPPSLVVNARYVKGLGAFGATWGATVKHGTISSYRYVVLSWKGVSPDFDTLALSLASDPLALAPEWAALTPWTVTDQPRLLETTLQLAHGMTLYVAVQAKTPTGPWSEVAYSDAIVVDGMKPQFSPRAPDAIKGKKQMVLSWNAPAMGPSGVERYVVERRRGTKPTWEVLVSAQAPRLDLPASSGSEEWSLWYPALLEVRGKRYEENSKEVSGNNRSAPALQLPNYQINKLINAPIETKLTPYLTSTSSVLPLEDGTSYYRVKAVSGAGEESEPTATTKVVAGLENLPHLLNEVSNYPNPFDSRVKSTTLVYVLNQDAKVTVHLLTVLGERLHEWTFDAGAPGGQAGANEVTWDGANVLGQKVTTGAYLAVVRATGGDGKTEQVVRKVGVKH